MSWLDLTSTPSDTNELLPNGVYLAKIAKAELKETKSGTGKYINVQLKVIEGEYENKSVFTMFNVENSNPKAVEIGLSQLKSMLHAAKAPFKLDSVEDLVGYDLGVKVATKTDEFGEKNIVKGYTTKDMIAHAAKTNTNLDNVPF